MLRHGEVGGGVPGQQVGGLPAAEQEQPEHEDTKLLALGADGGDHAADGGEAVAELQARSSPTAEHQSRQHLRHHGRAGRHRRRGDAAPRCLVTEDVLDDERSDRDGGAERRRADDLSTRQDAQDASLQFGAGDVVDPSTVASSRSLTMHAIAGTERKTWYARLWGALDPVEVLTELTSGLTITLVVLLTAGVVLQDGDHPVRVLLVLALGSTLAAGISAGILNALEDLHEAGDRTSWRARLRAMPRHQANALVEEQIEAVIGSDLEPADVARIAAAIVDRAPSVDDAPPRIRPGNVHTAVVSVVYNLAALLPAALPFLIFDDWHTAWRVSTAMVAVALVVVGTVWGRVAGISPLTCGLVLASVGLVEIVAAFVLEAL